MNERQTHVHWLCCCPCRNLIGLVDGCYIFMSNMSGNILNFLICYREKNFKFNLLIIATDGFTFKCPELKHTECFVSVLGCISIDDPCFVKKLMVFTKCASLHQIPISPFRISCLSWNQKKKGGVSLKVVNETIVEQWGFGLIEKPFSILFPGQI